MTLFPASVLVSLFVWRLPFDLSSKEGPASSYATAGIALRVIGALKPPHHDKVEAPILFNLYSECLTKEVLDGLGDFNIGEQIIQTVKYADDFVLKAKEEKVLQGMIDKLLKSEVAMAWKWMWKKQK